MTMIGLCVRETRMGTCLRETRMGICVRVCSCLNPKPCEVCMFDHEVHFVCDHDGCVSVHV